MSEVPTAEKDALPFVCCEHCGCPTGERIGHDDTCRLCQCSCGNRYDGERQKPMPDAEKDAAVLTDEERMALAQAIYAHAGHAPPKGIYDLSMVRNPVEQAVEHILAARITSPGGGA